MKRTIFSEEHDLFRAEFRRFAETEFLPHGEEWHEAGISPRWAWEKMGENGFLGANQAVGGAPAASPPVSAVEVSVLIMDLQRPVRHTALEAQSPGLDLNHPFSAPWP